MALVVSDASHLTRARAWLSDQGPASDAG
jgi:uncharacterized SAM-binding protein YcdF (DUF218 family)